MYKSASAANAIRQPCDRRGVAGGDLLLPERQQLERQRLPHGLGAADIRKRPRGFAVLRNHQRRGALPQLADDLRAVGL